MEEGQRIIIDGVTYTVIKIRHGNITIRAGETDAPALSVEERANHWDDTWTLQELKDWAEANGTPLPYYITRKGDVLEWLAKEAS